MRRSKSREILRLALMCVAGLALPWINVSRAQVTTATFYGIATDPSGAVIPNASVTLIQEETGTSSTKVTDTSGEFVFDFLHVGAYTLKIEAPGFKTYTG